MAPASRSSTGSLPRSTSEQAPRKRTPSLRAPKNPMGKPGKPNPLESRSGPNRGSLGPTAILVLIAVLIFAGLIIWAALD